MKLREYKSSEPSRYHNKKVIYQTAYLLSCCLIFSHCLLSTSCPVIRAIKQLPCSWMCWLLNSVPICRPHLVTVMDCQTQSRHHILPPELWPECLCFQFQGKIKRLFNAPYVHIKVINRVRRSNGHSIGYH